MDMPFVSLLARLAATSVQTLVLALVVWVVCRSVKRLPAASQCWLWWLVALQAVVGLLAPAALELPWLPAAQQAAAVVAPAAAATATPVPADASGWSVARALAAFWGAGVLLLALRTAMAYRASRRLLRDALPCPDPRLDGALRLAADAHGLARAPRLLVSARIDSPQLVGPWRPVLLLPARQLATMADDDLDMALTHELVHLVRRDLWLGLLPTLAQHLFFFHPAVHLAAREYAIAREAACDAAVVAGHRHCRHDYGRLLVQFGVARRPHGGLASASPNFLSLKRRLQQLQQAERLPRVVAGLMVALALVGVVPMRLVAKPVAVPAAAPVAQPSVQPSVQPAARPAAAAAATTAPAASAAAPTVAPLPDPLPAPAAIPDVVQLPSPPKPPSPPSAPSAPSAPRAPAAPPSPPALADPWDGLAARIDAAMAEVDGAKVEHAMAKAERHRADLDRAQAELAKQQEELGRRMGSLGIEAAALALDQVGTALKVIGDDPTRLDQVQASIDAAAEQAAAAALKAAHQQGLDRRIAEVATRQAELATRQAAIALRQSSAAQRAADDAAARADRAADQAERQ